MSRLTPIYTIYGLRYTTFGLGGRHTGQAGYLAGLLGPLLGLQLIMKSERVLPETADLFSGNDKIDREEEEFLVQQAAKNQNKNGGSWFYSYFVGGCFERGSTS
jgi:amino acid transporter